MRTDLLDALRLTNQVIVQIPSSMQAHEIAELRARLWAGGVDPSRVQFFVGRQEMATVGNVTLQAAVSGAPSGARTFGPSSIMLAAAVDATSLIALISGNTTVSVPTGATVCILAPPNATNPQPSPTYSGTITLKGVAGDTGVVISNKYPTMLSWDTAPASFVLTATVVGTLEAWFA